MRRDQNRLRSGRADLGARAGDGLPLPRKLGVAIGDFGLNLYWQSITYYLLFFYTEVVGIDVVTAGLIYMCASIFDGVMDPLAGSLMDRTNTRHGRYRPWIALSAVPLAASFCLLYWKPPLAGATLVTVVVAAHLLFRICYTCVAVPVASLTAAVTRDSAERSSLTGMRLMFATAAAVLVASGTRPMAGWFGGGAAQGWLVVAALSGLTACLVFAAVVGLTREMAPPAADAAPMRLSFATRMRLVSRNGAFLCLVAGLLGATLAITVVSKSIAYYFKYVVHDEGAGTLALTVVTFSAFVSVPFWTMVARRIGKRGLWLTGIAIALAAVAVFAATRPTSGLLATAIYLVLQFAITAIAVAYWAMLPDTVEFGQWRTGVRLESFLVGFFMFFQKMGLGLAAGLFGRALEFAGVNHGAVQSGGVTQSLPLIVAGLAAAGFIASGIAILLSPLRHGVHERVCLDLERAEFA